MIYEAGKTRISIREQFNHGLDKLVCPEVHLFQRTQSTYLIFAYVGLLLAVLLAISLVTFLGLSVWVMAGLTLTAVLTIFGLLMVTKIITGEENMTYYHYEIAVIISAAILLKLLHEPVLPYLGITLIGIGLFLACGRLGCLMVGCCHGRPHQWGVCYREEHAAAGFPHYFVGVRLFPIQLVESIWVFGVVLGGIVLILTGRPPGEALSWYIVAYDIGRFCFEFVRGDAARPYRWGFSEAQWTSLLLMCAVVWAELSGVLPLHPWHVGATAGMVIIMITLYLSRRFYRTTKHELLHPHHIRDVAEALDLLFHRSEESLSTSDETSASEAIQVGCTSLGIRISASTIKHQVGDVYHYTLSSQNDPLTPETASILSRLILQLKPNSGSYELLEGNQSIFHLLLYPSPGKSYITGLGQVSANPWG